MGEQGLAAVAKAGARVVARVVAPEEGPAGARVEWTVAGAMVQVLTAVVARGAELTVMAAEVTAVVAMVAVAMAVVAPEAWKAAARAAEKVVAVSAALAAAAASVGRTLLR